jgi:DNA-binding MarR family transcriptional regulator
LTRRAGWLLIRVGEHPGDTSRRLAERLYISLDNLHKRRGELLSLGYLAAPQSPDDILVMTESGRVAHEKLFAGRQDRIERFLQGWDPDSHPDLLRLLSRSLMSLPQQTSSPDGPGTGRGRLLTAGSGG